MYKLCVLLLFLTVKFVLPDSIAFQDCGSEYYLFDVNIQGCSGLPCPLVIGETKGISMGIIANAASQELHQEVNVILRTIYRRLEVTPDTPCANIPCPTSSNLDISFSANMTIDSTLVPLDGDLYWRIIDENGSTVVCMMTSIILQTA